MKAVGNFSQAYKWNYMASSLVFNAVGQIAQPVLVSIKDERDREKQVFRKMIRFTSFLSFPAMFGLALISNEFIMLTIGPKWTDSVPLLQILCIGGAFYPLYTVYQNLTISNGRSDLYMWCNIGQIVLQIAIIVALHSFGMTVMVIAYSAFMIAWLMVWQSIAHKLIGVRFIDTLKDTVPFCIASLATMAITFAVTLPIHNNAVLLIIRIIIATIVYYGIMRVCHVVILDECIKFITKKMKKRN